LCTPEFGEAEEAAVLEVIRSGWLTMGPQTESLEAEFAAELQVADAVAVSSGTAALHLALLGLGIGSDDEVIQPAINFTAAANMTVAVGARPVFADIISMERPVIGPEQIERVRTPRAIAVVAMHYGGYACDMLALRRYCREHRLLLIEDACHAVGGYCGSRPLGTWGDVGCFSFFSNKNLAAGEGGMLVTNSDELGEHVRRLRCHGMTAATWSRHQGAANGYDVEFHGFNYRIDEMRAALARVQLGRLEEITERRRRHTHTYAAMLADSSIVTPVGGADIDSSACHLMAVTAEPGERNALRGACRTRGVQTSLHYPCLAEMSAFRGMTDPRRLPVSREFARRELTLPLCPSLRQEQIERVCQAIRGEEMVAV